jgi:transcriptional regulator of acetoin/glycerol metabolism
MSQVRDDARKVLALRGLGIVFVHPDPGPRFVPFHAKPVVLGRNPDCDVPLDGRAVSWEHAEILLAGRTAVIRDLGSTNGVMVDGARVQEAPLAEGALVRLGDFLGVVTAPPPTDSRESLEAAAAVVGMYLGPTLQAALEPLVVARGEPLPIVLEGETGSGKTLTARLIHAQERRTGPFVTLDCDAVDPFETTRRLFGDGASHGALAASVGGTVYLGSIAALEPTLQERLARTLADGEWGQVGLVIGSQEPLATAVADGRLVHALYHQLDGVKVRLPPLRRRVVEIPALFKHLYRRHGRGQVPPLSTEMVERLCLYDWPCNAREMVLLLLRLISLHGDEERLRSAHLPARMLPPDQDNRTTSPVLPLGSALDVPLVLDAVREAGGNMTRAAHRLGISRERAYRLLDRIGLSAGRAGA